MAQACTTIEVALLGKGLLNDGHLCEERAWEYAQQARMPVSKERAAAYPIHNSPWLANPDQYRKWFARRQDVVREVKPQRYEPGVLGAMSAVSALAGEPEASRDFLLRLDAIGPVTLIAQHGVAQYILGDREAARRLLASYNWNSVGAARWRAIGVAPHYGRLHLDMGEPENAEDLLRVQWEYCREQGAVTHEINLLPPLIESYVRLARLEEACVCVSRAQEILSKPEDWKGLAAGVALAEALLAAAEQRWLESETAFQQAVHVNERYGLVYDQVRTLYQWAVMLLDRASRDASAASGRADAREDGQRGLELLDQSLGLFQRCDAKKDIERVSALRAQVESQTAPLPAFPDGLTPREVEVLRLVPGGRSNPEIGEELFISPRTVTTHVSNILNQINAANRAEAATYATRNGLIPEQGPGAHVSK